MDKNSKSPKGHYEVGYGRPPGHTRFKKGQSGNPSGRPKGRVKVTNIDLVLDEVASVAIAVNDNGRHRKISKLKALITSEFNKALKGNPSSVKSIVSLLSKRSARAEPDNFEPESTAEEARKDFDDFLNGIAARSSKAAEAPKRQDERKIE